MTRARPNRSGFEQRLLKTLRALDVSSGERLVVAFSGGSDSLALAAALARIAPVLNVEPILTHVDHRLRPGSERDAESCSLLAQQLGLPIEVIALKPGLRDRSTGIGLEEAARRERYAALADSAFELGTRNVLLAHQANDQAETVLLHLFRGSGIDGLAGMRSRELRSVPWWETPDRSARSLILLRPLLSEPKVEIEAYLGSIGLRPVEDESNQSKEFDRNWIRLDVLSAILSRWPAAIETIARTTEVIDLDRGLLNELTRDAIETSTRSDRTLCTDTLLSLHPSIRYRVLRHWIASLGIEDASFDAVQRVSELVLDRDESRRVELGNRLSAVLAGDRLTTLDAFYREAGSIFPIDVESDGSARDIVVTTSICPEDVVISVPRDLEPIVRAIRNGDRWIGTRRSVMDDLRQARVHPLIREHVLAVVAGDGVLLIPAIYPTIHGVGHSGPTKEVGVRWIKRS